MKLYFYDKDTKEYLYTKYATIDMKESEKLKQVVYYWPDNSTPTAVELRINQTAFWDNVSWNIVEDYRNQVYFDSLENKLVKIKQVGSLPTYYISLKNINSNKLDKAQIKPYVLELINKYFNQRLNGSISYKKYFLELNKINYYYTILKNTNKTNKIKILNLKHKEIEIKIKNEELLRIIKLLQNEIESIKSYYKALLNRLEKEDSYNLIILASRFID